MAYRIAPPREGPAPTPVERLVVASYGVLGALAMGAFLVSMFVLTAWGARGGTTLTCIRAAAGAVPRCTGHDDGPFGHTLEPFELTPTALQVAAHGKGDGTAVALKTPRGELRRSVDRAFAQGAVADAGAFLARPAELRWEASRSSEGAAALVVIVGILIVGGMAWVMRSQPVVIDRGAGLLRVGRSKVFPLERLTSAKTRSIERSTFHSLVLVDGGVDADVVRGRHDDVLRAATAIVAALAERHGSTRTMPQELKHMVRRLGVARGGPLDGFHALEDEAKWLAMDRFLRSLPIDSLEVVRDVKERRIEARGTRRSVPIRVAYDATMSLPTEIVARIHCRLGFLDLQHDPEAPPDPTRDRAKAGRVVVGPGVSANDAAAARAFHWLPVDLQHRITTAMPALGVRLLHIRPKETTLSTLDSPCELRDPVAQVSAVLDLVAEVAVAASAVRPPKRRKGGPRGAAPG